MWPGHRGKSLSPINEDSKQWITGKSSLGYEEFRNLGSYTVIVCLAVLSAGPAMHAWGHWAVPGINTCIVAPAAGTNNHHHQGHYHSFIPAYKNKIVKLFENFQSPLAPIAANALSPWASEGALCLAVQNLPAIAQAFLLNGRGGHLKTKDNKICSAHWLPILGRE